MKPFHLTLSLAAALFTVPAIAQGELAQAGVAPQEKPIRFEIGDVDADFGVVLLSLNDRALPFQSDWILCDAGMLLLGKERDDGTLALEMKLPVKWSADIYWQGVTYDAVKGLRIHSIQKFTPAVAGEIAADDGIVSAGEEPQVGDVADGNVPGGQQPAPIVQLEPIGLEFLPAEDGTPGSQLQARFMAPTNDYNLVLVRVDNYSDNGIEKGADDETVTADVYLYRKSPGVGEGMLDVVEEHTATADVGDAMVVRVFLAEGTRSRPGVATAWKLLATLTK